MAKLKCKSIPDGKFWFVECKHLDVATQGTSFEDSIEMLVDAIKVLADEEFEIEAIRYEDSKEGEFCIRMDEQVFLRMRAERKSS
jgi:predicted RNase H-like HicB family nuclease